MNRKSETTEPTPTSTEHELCHGDGHVGEKAVYESFSDPHESLFVGICESHTLQWIKASCICVIINKTLLVQFTNVVAFTLSYSCELLHQHTFNRVPIPTTPVHPIPLAGWLVYTLVSFVPESPFFSTIAEVSTENLHRITIMYLFTCCSNTVVVQFSSGNVQVALLFLRTSHQNTCFYEDSRFFSMLLLLLARRWLSLRKKKNVFHRRCSAWRTKIKIKSRMHILHTFSARLFRSRRRILEVERRTKSCKNRWAQLAFSLVPRHDERRPVEKWKSRRWNIHQHGFIFPNPLRPDVQCRCGNSVEGIMYPGAATGNSKFFLRKLNFPNHRRYASSFVNSSRKLRTEIYLCKVFSGVGR